MNYDDYKEFNDSLDDQYGQVEIAGFSEPASFVLYEMDEEAYRLAYEDYIEEQKSNFSDTIYNRFPAPIAFYFEQAENGYENSIQRLHLLRSSWEAVIYTLYAFVIGEVKYQNINLSSVRIFGNQQIRCNHSGLLSDKLGYKLEVLEKVIQHDKNNLGSQLITTGLTPITTIDKLRELNQERNSFSHIAALTEAQAHDRYEELFPRVFDLLFELKGLQNISFLQFNSTLSSIKHIRFLKFDGHSLKRHNYPKTLSHDVFNKINSFLIKDQMLVESGEEVFSLSPFAHVIDENGQPVLCFFKQKVRDQDKFKFEKIGTPVGEFELDKSIFDSHISSLEALLV